MLRNRVGKFLIASLFLLGTAGWLEATGYSAFDGGVGENPVCRLDPTCRGLSAAEIARAREVFGDALDYSRVKVFDRPSLATVPAKLLLGFGGIAETPNGNVYYQNHDYWGADVANDPRKLVLLMHELTHAWQHQTRDWLLVAAVREYVAAGYDYKALYAYDLGKGRAFRDLGVEQEASVVEDYAALRASARAARGREEWREEYCATVRRYEAVIGGALPVRPLGACRG